MEFFTDASYCNKTGLGVISIDIYLNDVLIKQMDKIYRGIKNSELEKTGVDICHENASEIGRDYIIYTDCNSNKSDKICWIKGHAKVDKEDKLRTRFRIVDIRSRKIMRQNRKEL